MKYEITIIPRTFHFCQPAGTSRGVYMTRQSWLLELTSPEKPGRKGVGECAPLPDLSCDYGAGYEETLRMMCDKFINEGQIDYKEMRDYPSMLFGLETALKHFECGSIDFYDTPFSRGEAGIPINGLVWMGTFAEMMQRIDEKIKQGFRCIKLKIGAIDFEKELDMVKYIRERFLYNELEIRLDANGGFKFDDALYKLELLSQYSIHSIEQPIKQHQWGNMAQLCRESPLPIALDEELIGINDPDMKEYMLNVIKPAYIILKPSLHGGMSGVKGWINIATNKGIKTWITSALESNIGLNSIAQFTAHEYGPNISMPQGLGTGMLFTDNIDMSLVIKDNRLWRKLAENRK
ncbi:o-succinylbenzoate synthase [uncultured Prevotella sp.]|uniref:o-succinylbenzoate synthase n=1 Tax=uncultured Prevotella sp. TaxID=159272 RepID=UPI002633A5BA|nr:o-succinylbenzoate synthase [uncultured Prevotella sp.]